MRPHVPGGHAGFRCAKGIQERGVEQPGGLGNFLPGDQVRHGADDVDRPGFDAAILQFLAESAHHAGNEHEPVDPQILQQPGQAVRLVAVHAPDRAATQQGGQAVVGGHHVVAGRPGHEVVLVGNVQDQVIQQAAGDHRAVADQRSLGQARGAAGVQDDEARLGVDVPRGKDIGALCNGRCVFCAENDPLGRGAGQATERGVQLGGDEYEPGRHQVDAVFQFAIEQSPVQGSQYGAGFRRCQQQFEVFEAVSAQYRNPVTGLDTTVHEIAGEAIASRLELGIAQGDVLVLQCDPAGVRSRHTVEQVANGRASRRQYEAC